MGKETIELEFVLSSSDDVIAQTLYRKIDLNEAWEEYATIENDENKFIDKEVKTGVKYYYSLQAKDDSDNLSEFSVPVMGKPYDDGIRPPVQNIKLSNQKNQASITWEYKEMDDKTYFVIYKKNQKGNLVQYKSVSEMIFSEKVKLNDEFAVKVFTKDGGQSKISKIVKVVKI
ncbi:hypothetical protein JCM19298_2129 [Nonlabens ulvanivorans]|nr:hypothetical protein [Nonlabens ulvanivorans]GAK93410.1 hypothetical protein JCM19298_2129 [Nonlabens ulvanivorans]